MLIATAMRSGRYRHVQSRFQQSKSLPASCESWISSREVETDPGARVGGELPENVTEERLYRGRLFDLARERHKVMLDSDYTRNQFIDNQVRKAKTLQELLKGFDIEQYRNKSTSVIEKLHQKSLHAKLMILATKKLGLSIEETSKYTEEELRQKLNILPEERDREKDGEDGFPQRPVTSRTQSLSHLGVQADSARPSTVGLNMGRSSSCYRLPRVGTSRQLSSSRQSVMLNARDAHTDDARRQFRPRTASARRRVQNDPRCVGLIQTLTPRYKPSASNDVNSIIKSNSSLSQPTAGKVELKQKQAPKSRRQALEVLDEFRRVRYYENHNLATLS